jgi:Cu+-exporting ATPase
MLSYLQRYILIFYRQLRRKKMESQTLQLLDAFNDEGALDIARTLQSVKGVQKVTLTTAAGIVKVDFDGDVTSTQELRAVLQNTGLRVKKPAHGEEGTCCGSCGS